MKERLDQQNINRSSITARSSSYIVYIKASFGTVQKRLAQLVSKRFSKEALRKRYHVPRSSLSLSFTKGCRVCKQSVNQPPN